MARPNAVFVRGSCGGETLKWQGQCPVCGEGNSLEQRNPARTRPAAPAVAVSLGGHLRGMPGALAAARRSWTGSWAGASSRGR